MSKQGPSGEVPANVNVSGGQGIQIGTGNNQYNAWMLKPQLDPAALGALNPHTAVARLQQLPHDELVDFFTRAKPEDVSEILPVFFDVDLLKLAAALAEVSRRKATDLIRAPGDDFFAVVGDLPEAAEAVAREAVRLRWTDASSLEVFPIGGYARKYRDGHIFWSANHGTWKTVGAIDGCIPEGEELPWGFPVGDQKTAASSPFGTQGTRQKFEEGMVYSSDHGVYCIEDAGCHEDAGGSGGWLGFPVGERKQNGPFGKMQKFEGGCIFSTEEPAKSQHPIAVTSSVVDALPDYGGWWRPLSEQTATESSSGTYGSVQVFELTQSIWNSETEQEAFYSLQNAVCTSEPYGTFLVTARVWEYYRDLGAEKSRLGFPIEAGSAPFTPRGTQFFEGGLVFWEPGIGPFSVLGAALEFVTQDGGRNKSLGYPVSEEQPAGADGSWRLQFFERGVVTLRDGEYEAWLRPDPKPASSEEHAATTPPKDIAVLPLADYDELSAASLRARLSSLRMEQLDRFSVEEVKQVLDYEKSHAARPDVLAVLEEYVAALAPFAILRRFRPPKGI